MGEIRLPGAALRRIYYRNRVVRQIDAALITVRTRRESPDLAHLARYSKWGRWGPVQRDEALLLHALVRALRPATVLEVGFLLGHSAFNFLRALDDDARLYSIDVNPECVACAALRCQHDPRFALRVISQTDITSNDLDGRPIDFVFLDGAHELELNQRAFERIHPLLTQRAVVAIHDTGGFPRSLIPLDAAEGDLGRWAGDEYEHQPDERAFANWLLSTHPEFAQIHLHSRRALRHGITLLQRTAALERPAGAPS